MTTIQRARFTSTAWTTFPEPLRAVRRASVWTAGMDDGGLVDDLARELADRLTWGIYGEPVIPATMGKSSIPRLVQTSNRRLRDCGDSSRRPNSTLSARMSWWLTYCVSATGESRTSKTASTHSRTQR